jgi:CDP-diacylglycerol--glycerol-3-phosphate 3-phosphatidyltransferase
VGQAVENKPKSFEEFMRATFKGVFEPIALFLTGIGVKPNAVTISGLIGHIVAATLATWGYMTYAGLVTLVMAPVDFLDGTMARMKGESSKFGAFVDSVTDRYSELFILGGLLLYYLRQGDWVACLIIYIAAAGSVLVSYIRSRAEGLGFEAKVGLLSRVERYVVLIPALIFNVPIPGVLIIAVFANFTALQRIWYVRKQYYESKKQQSQVE